MPNTTITTTSSTKVIALLKYLFTVLCVTLFIHCMVWCEYCNFLVCSVVLWLLICFFVKVSCFYDIFMMLDSRLKLGLFKTVSWALFFIEICCIVGGFGAIYIE